MFPYTGKSMIIHAYLITYNITFVGWIILHGINMPHHIFSYMNLSFSTIMMQRPVIIFLNF